MSGKTLCDATNYGAESHDRETPEYDNTQVINSEKPYRCEEPNCDASFTRPDRLQTHKLVHYYGERPFKCDYEGCDKSYVNNSHLMRHKATSHSLGMQTQETLQAICEEAGCGKIYCNKYVLKQHVDRAHTYIYIPSKDNNSDEVQLTNIIKPATVKMSDVEKRHKCDEPDCHAAFNRPYKLKNHKLTFHCGEKPFKCDLENCDKSYTNQSHLTRHKLSHYQPKVGPVEKLICEMEGCERVLSNKYSLKKHMLNYHTRIRIACQECNQEFNRESQLHNHMMEVHKEGSPYKCNKCSKVFVQRLVYERHVKRHKTYQCYCKKTFHVWSHLLKHRRTECSNRSSHKCLICGKKFASKHTLSQHSLNVHILDSPMYLLKCPYLNCDRSYKYRTNLNQHIKTYHEKLFHRVKCPEPNCEMVLKSNKNLKQHLKTIHSGQPTKTRTLGKPQRKRKKYKCEFEGCDQQYINKTSLVRHRIREHRKKITFEEEKIIEACNNFFETGEEFLFYRDIKMEDIKNEENIIGEGDSVFGNSYVSGFKGIKTEDCQSEEKRMVEEGVLSTKEGFYYHKIIKTEANHTEEESIVEGENGSVTAKDFFFSKIQDGQMEEAKNVYTNDFSCLEKINLEDSQIREAKTVELRVINTTEAFLGQKEFEIENSQTDEEAIAEVSHSASRNEDLSFHKKINNKGSQNKEEKRDRQSE